MEKPWEERSLDIIEMLERKSRGRKSLQAEENFMKESIFMLLSVLMLA
jgi:hypothetical protein